MHANNNKDLLTGNQCFDVVRLPKYDTEEEFFVFFTCFK